MKLSMVLKRLVQGIGLPVEFGWQVRFELQALIVRTLYRMNPVQVMKIRNYRKGVNLKINFGCGDTHFEGWVNVDGIPNRKADVLLDLRRRLPFATNSVRCIFAEHVVEHFRLDEARLFLSESSRILSTGGSIRIIVPDLEKFAQAYVNRDAVFFADASPALTDPVEALNLVFRQAGSHNYMHDFSSLARLLDSAGFGEIRKSSFRAGDDPELNLDDDSLQRRSESLYVDAKKIS